MHEGSIEVVRKADLVDEIVPLSAMFRQDRWGQSIGEGTLTKAE